MSELVINDHRSEGRKIFDMSSSVMLLRHDLEQNGAVHPETVQRVFDEEMTYLAEGVNRSLYTKFELKSVDGRLVYFDKGRWRPYVETLESAVEVAREQASRDHKKTFLFDMCVSDLSIGLALEALETGKKVNWFSPYPIAVEEKYGKQLLRESGFQPERRMGFLYQATKNHDGSLMLETQSVDTSDDYAFKCAIYEADQAEQKTINDMRTAYDSALAEKYGGIYFAGRKVRPGMKNENAWDLIREHSDLLNYFMQGIQDLAAAFHLDKEQVETEKKLLTYGVWAALKQRLDTSKLPAGQHRATVGYPVEYIHLEVQQAFREYSERGEVLVGCGGSIKGVRDAVRDSDPQDVFNDVFGEDGKDKWVWKKGVCRVDACPTRPGQTEVGPCAVCRNCQHWFDKGHDPQKLYRGLRLATLDAVTTKTKNNSKTTKLKKKVEAV